jgi:hypothetical protein
MSNHDLKFLNHFSPKLAAPSPLVASSSNCIHQNLLRSELDINHIITFDLPRSDEGYTSHKSKARFSNTWNMEYFGTANIFSGPVGYYVVLFLP